MDPQPRENDGLATLFLRLIGDAREAARARLRFYRIAARRPLRQLVLALVLIGSAVALLFAGLCALLVGAVIALARFIGPAGAAVVVFVVASILAALMIWLAIGRLRRATDLRALKQLRNRP